MNLTPEVKDNGIDCPARAIYCDRTDGLVDASTATRLRILAMRIVETTGQACWIDMRVSMWCPTMRVRCLDADWNETVLVEITDSWANAFEVLEYTAREGL
jgi:hypothetical protein